MAYSELIKSFSRIRSYMRSFYVYGFRHRNEYDEKSARGYDNERRRMESWLGDYMCFGQDVDGKRTFLSVDSRAVAHNPLYRVFKAKSFTNRDIMLHFHLLDILEDTEGLSITEIMDELAERLNEFDSDEIPDESTIRKKLREYVDLGLLQREKRGRETVYYASADDVNLKSWQTAIDFYAEAAPLGVIGSYVQDRFPEHKSAFRFKHHYILNALDSEVLYEILSAIEEKCIVSLTKGKQKINVIPLKLYISTQTGRQYLLAWIPWNERFSFYRVDQINAVKVGEKASYPDSLIEKMVFFQRHVWGTASGNSSTLDHLEMTISVEKNEGFIIERLNREKRCGLVEQLDARHWRFTVDIFDASEILPWIRTFTGRITDFRCSKPVVMERFYGDLEAMAALYGGGKTDAVS